MTYLEREYVKLVRLRIIDNAIDMITASSMDVDPDRDSSRSTVPMTGPG